MNVTNLLEECEKSISDELLPNPACNYKYLNNFSLPIGAFGLNILKPEDRFEEYERSVHLSNPLSRSLHEADLKQQKIIHEIRKYKRSKLSSAVARGTFAPKSTAIDDDARLDIKADVFWEPRFNRTYLDRQKSALLL